VAPVASFPFGLAGGQRGCVNPSRFIWAP